MLFILNRKNWKDVKAQKIPLGNGNGNAISVKIDLEPKKKQRNMKKGVGNMPFNEVVTTC